MDVATVHGKFTIEYNGYGIGYESVFVNGKLAARRKGFSRMSHRFEFVVGDSPAALTVAIPAWGEVIPLCNLSAFSLELDGCRVYAESVS